MRHTLLASCFVTLFGATSACAQSEPTYWRDVRPLFRKHCTVCHSAKNLKEPDVSGGLALDSYAAALKGGERVVIRPGQSGESHLVRLLVSENVKRRMPLDAPPLPAETIALIRRWIDAGAKEGMPTATPETPTIVTKRGPARRLVVRLPTTALPPAGLLGKGGAAKLNLALKVGPLAPVAAVAFSPDGKLLAAGSYGHVALWDLATARCVRVLTNVLGAVNDLKFSPDGKLLAVAGGQPSAKGDLRLYQTSDWKLLGVLRGHDDVAFSVAFSPDGKRLASASFDQSVRLWDVSMRAALRSFKHHSDFVYAVAFSPDGKRLASVSKDRTVQIIDAETGKTLFTGSGLEQDVMAVAFHPDGKSVVSSGFETALSWWNAQTGEKVRTQRGHGVAVHELAFSKDGKRLLSASADRTVRLWDGATGAPVKTFTVGSITYAAALSPDGRRIAAGSFDGLVRLFDVTTGRTLATLATFADSQGQPEWLALTPEGYTSGSDGLPALGRWRMAGRDVADAAVWAALRQPAQVARALRGEALPAPTFKK